MISRKKAVMTLKVAAITLCSGLCSSCFLTNDLDAVPAVAVERFFLAFFLGHTLRCENGVITEYVVAGDGTLTPVPGQTLDVGQCPPSLNDDARPNSTSDVFTQNNFTSVNSPSRAASQTTQLQLQDEFSLLFPLPFAPLFSASMLAGYLPNCTPGTSFYVVNHFDGAVTHVGLCPLSQITRIMVGSNPLQVAVTPDSATLVVTRYDNAVVFIDTATDTISGTLNTGTMNPSGIAISPDGSRAYVTNYFVTNPGVMVIDMATRQITGMIPTGIFPKSVFLTPDGSQAWVTFYQSSSISIIDTLTQTVTATVNVGGQADTGLAFDPTGSHAYVATLPNQLIVIDTATLDRVASITVGSAPADVVVSPDGSRVFVNSSVAPVVSVIDATTNMLLKNASVKGPAMGLALFH